MTLSDLAALGSFVSGFAVLVSLVFLYFQMRRMTDQMRQTDRNQRASIRMGRTTRANDLFAMWASPLVAPVLAKVFSGSEDLSELDATTFMSFCTALLTNWEDSYVQHRAGLLDDTIMESEVGSIKTLCSQPSFRAMWQFVRRLFSQDFCNYIDKHMEQVTMFQPGEMVPAFKIALREQIARAVPFPSDNEPSDSKAG